MVEVDRETGLAHKMFLDRKGDTVQQAKSQFLRVTVSLCVPILFAINLLVDSISEHSSCVNRLAFDAYSACRIYIGPLFRKNVILFGISMLR